MNTQLPILNAVSASTAAPAPAQAESARAGASFNQILNKEVSNRKSETSSSEANAAAAKNSSPTPSTSTQPQANTENQAKPTEPVHANAQETGRPAENTASVKDTKDGKEAKSTSSAHKKGNEQTEQAEQDDEHANSNAASAQILALVSGVGQLNNHQNGTGGQGQRQTNDQLQSLDGDSKNGKKHVAAIGVGAGIGLGAAAGAGAAAGIGTQEAPSKLGGLKAQGEGIGQGKQFSLNDPQEKPLSPKVGANASSGLDLHAATEKSLAEGAFGTKAAFALAQVKDQQANSQHTTVPVDANPKLGDANLQANSLALAPAVQQSMSLNQQGAIAGQPTERLTPAVGSPGWDQAVGQKVVWMASGGLQSASLTLNPPDLGPLQVVLHVHNDQADATFITAQPEVKQALEAAMPKLREMLDASGIQLSQATVNTGLPNQQQGGNRQDFASGRGAASGLGSKGDEGELNVATIPVRPTTGGLGMVDTFA